MKTNLLAAATFIASIALLSGQTTNLPPGVLPTPVIRALPAPITRAEPPSPSVNVSNTAGVVQTISSLPDRAIRPAPGGARAEFGLLKPFFPVDVKAGAPVTLTTPDGRILSFRASFIALHDLATDQSLLIAEVTNSIGAIAGPKEVIYIDAFDTLQADIRYRISENGFSFEQDILLHESPRLPDEFSPHTVRLEIWTEWFDSEPVSKVTQTVDLRGDDPTGLLTPSLMDDDGIDFGTARIVNGRAFSSTAQDELTPVGKTWVRIDGRQWLVETVDYLAVQSKLDLLPKARRSASSMRPMSKREMLIRSLAKQSMPAPKNEDRMRMAANKRPKRAEFVMDFVIVSSVPVPSGVISWWPAGGNANDVITNNHGTLYGSATNGAGWVGQGFIFTGGYFAATNSASLNPTNGLSIETWLYFSSNGNMPIVSKDSPSGRQYLFSKYSDNKIRAHVGITNGSFCFTDSQATLQSNTWYHVAMTYSVAASNLAIYINGVLDTNVQVIGSLRTTTEPVYIAGAPPWSYYYTDYTGGIDEPTIYDRALGASEIQAIYDAGAAGKINPKCITAPTNIIAWWPGDGNIYDLARTNFATLSGGANYESAVVGKGFTFNGQAAGVTAGDDNALNLATTNDNVSIEVWIKPLTNATTFNVMSVVGKRYAPNSTTATGYELFMSSGAPGFQIANASGAFNFIAAGNLRVGGYHHVVVTLDRSSTNGGNIYVDGTSILTFNPTVLSGSLSNSAPVRIGMHPQSGFNGWYKGVIDEPTVYDRALTSSEVTALYSAGSAGKCKTDTDTDGLTDLQEDFLGTDPEDDDSDNDGLTDGDEVFVHGTQPNNPDTDSDGLSDGQEISGSTNPKVANLPVILTQPQDQTVETGNNATFSVTMTGSVITSYRYQWRSNTVSIAGATDTTFTLTNVLPSYAGNYSVIVTNVAGSVTSSNALLTVTCVSPPSGLVGWWQAESSSYDTISNQHGYFVDGSYTNGYQNKTFRFNGTSSYVHIPDSPAQKLTNLTMEAWVYPSGASSWQTVILKETANDLSYALYANDNASRPAAYVRVNGDTHSAVGGAPLPLNTWTHLSASYNGTTLRLYTNGVLIGTKSITGSIELSSYPLNIGGNKVPDWGGEYFSGRIDEVALYNRALSSNEIATLYRAGALGKCPPAPRIIPGQLNALVGNTATLVALGSGESPVSYQWRYNGGEIPGATNSTLPFSNLQLTNTGNYSVTLSNIHGVSTAAEALLVSSCYPAVDVALVIDRSGSMEGSQIVGAKTACSNFVQSLNFTNDQVSLISFATGVSTNLTLTNNQPLLLQKIGQIDTGGSTYMGNALLAAQAELTSIRHNSNALPVVVFLTDGEPTDSTNFILGIATQIKQSGTHIITVGFGTNLLTSGLNLLRAMASTTNHFYQATNSIQLTNVYGLIADSICRSQTNQPLTVTIVSPTNGHSMLALDTVTISAAASTGVTNSISWVQFLVASNGASSSILDFAVSPNTNGLYEVDWTPLFGGTYALTAKVTDSRGSNAISAPVTISVRGRPTVSITTPTNLAVLGPSILNTTVIATAEADQATITNVLFYQSTNFIGSAATGPNYQMTWSNVNEGTYTLRARAYDSFGLSGASLPVNITVIHSNLPPVVNAGPDLTLRLPHPGFLAGSVTNDGLPLNSPLSIQWTNLSKPSGADDIAFSNENQAATYATFSKVGYYTNRLQATDGVLTNADEMVVLVLDTNLPPVVYPGEDRVITDSMAVQLHGYVTDDGQPTNGSLVSYWRVIEGPGAVDFTDSAQTNTVAVFNVQGTYLLGLTAFDGELTAISNVSITVSSNVFNYGSSFLYRILHEEEKIGFEFFRTNFYEIDTNNVSVFTNLFQSLYTNFYAIDFDESQFTNGEAAFGNTNKPTCGLNTTEFVHTPWPELSTLLLRKQFTIPPGTTNLNLAFTVDNIALVFLNGIFVDWRYNETCAWWDDFVITNIPPSIWHEGENLLAVCALDDQGATFLDFRIGLDDLVLIQTNHPPIVAVGPDQSIVLTNEATLTGIVLDDGVSGNGWATWTNVSGPGDVWFNLTNAWATNEFGQWFLKFTDVSVNAQFSAPGEYVLRLIADDFQFSVFKELTVIVNEGAVAAPVVNLVTPDNNAVFLTGASISMAATATATTGTVSRVEFFASKGSGYFLVGRATKSPYAINWMGLDAGTYTVQARATDQAGRIGVSSTRTIHVLSLDGNNLPIANVDQKSVLLNSRKNVIDVLQNDTDADGDPLTVISVGNLNLPGTVNFTDNGKKLSFTPTTDTSGGGWFEYSISDGRGGTATNYVSVNILVPEQPSIQLTSPTNTQAFAWHDTVTVTAAITTNIATVANVEFYRNGRLLGTLTNAPYSINWTALSGTHRFYALLTDELGQQQPSSNVTITVSTNPNDQNLPVALLDLVPQLTEAGTFQPPIVRDGFFTLTGTAADADVGDAVSYQINLWDMEGDFVADLTPAPLNSYGFHSGAVNDSVLATNDFTAIRNGLYNLELIVRGGDREARTNVTFALESNLKIGQFSFSQQDLVIPVNGIPLTVVRTYNSLNTLPNTAPGDFGYGWTYAINDMEIELYEYRKDVSAELDDDDDDFFSLTRTFSLRMGGERDVTLTLPGGQRTTFRLEFDSEGFGKYRAKWTRAPGVTATLEAQGDTVLYDYSGVPDVPPGIYPKWSAEGDEVPFDNYDIPGFILTTVDGTKFVINREDLGDHTAPNDDRPPYFIHTWGKPYLAQIIQRSGDTITISTNSIVHSNLVSGVTRRVVFQRNDDGFISGISDPNGLNPDGSTNGPLAMKYEYDSRTNLLNVLTLVDRQTATYVTNTFNYTNLNHPHFITSIVDPRGIPLARNEYDNDGRLTAVVDADGKRTEFGHDTNGRFERVIDRLGNTNTFVYDPRGNVIITTNAVGMVTTNGYDGFDNKTNEVVILNGQPYATNRFVFDTSDPKRVDLLLTSINALGESNSYTYNANGQVLVSLRPCGCSGATNYYEETTGQLIASSDALGNTTSNYYDAAGLLAGTRDAIGTLTTNKYDGDGNLIGSMTYVGATILSTNSYAYDANGNQTNSISWRTNSAAGGWLGATNTTIYDAQNRVVKIIAPDGGETLTFCNVLGKQDYTVDALNHTNRFAYDTQGRLWLTTYADGTTNASYFEAEGRTTNSVDQAGRGTTNYFDSLGRVTHTVYADNTTNRTFYDGVGRVQFSVDARNVTNAFGYDLLGRRTSVTNALGISGIETISRYSYDANGNQIYFTNALGIVTTNLYDALNRLTNVSFADGTKQLTFFDAGGRRSASVDQAGITNWFAYDGAGRLTFVTNALGKVTRYEYDEAGNQTAQIDALNRTNKFEFDSMGRRIKRILAGNQTETFGYDLGGNLIRHTNFNQVVITNQYDLMNQLTNRTSASGYQVSYGHSVTGQRTNMVDASGTTTYAYDVRGRLTNCVNAAGELHYRYDEAGNLTNLWSATANGVSVRYSYDELNRLRTVTNVVSGTPSLAALYGYDGVGNLKTTQYGNNLTNQYRYDALNRLTNVVWKLTTQTIGDFSYKLGVTGNRTNLSETVFNGTSSESRTCAWQYDAAYRLTNETIGVTAPTGTLGYNYDDVGNRLARTGTLGSLGGQTFNFDKSDRIDNDSDPATASTLFDANGNTTSYGGTYQYDVENRLLTASGTVTIVYDGDGNRIKKTAGGVTTWYLVATVNPAGYAQVVEEKTGTAPTTLNRVYTYGHDLVNQREAGGTVYYFGYDGHGSTRFLLNGSTVANVFAYDAYGTLIASNTTAQTAYLYVGEQWDADLGFYYNRARYLNPAIGRFQTMDSYEGDNEDPLSLHKYLACHDNSINRVDPTGREAIATVVSSLSIQNELSGFALSATSTTLLGTFGPEVAKPLMKTLVHMELAFWQLDEKNKKRACGELISVTGFLNPFGSGGGGKAWELEPLYTWGTLDKMVSFRGKGYYASAVNYAMWGRCNHSCYEAAKVYEWGSPDRWSLKSALNWTWRWKVWLLSDNSRRTTEAMAFTKFGYDGNLSDNGTTNYKWDGKNYRADQFDWYWAPFKPK